MSTIDTDSRPIRGRYLQALEVRTAQESARERAFALALSIAKRNDATPRLVLDDLELHVRVTARLAQALRTKQAQAAMPGTGEALAIQACEEGRISASQLMSTIPDEHGRTSPFAVFGTAPTGRSVTIGRNYTLPDAIRQAMRSEASGYTSVHVSYDVCG